MQAWSAFLEELAKPLGQKTVDRWLRSLKVVDFDACNLYLEAPDSLHILWFEEHVRKRAIAELCNKNHRPIKVHLTAQDVANPEPKKRKGARPAPLPVCQSPIALSSDPLDPHATFETFLPSPKNEYPLKFLSQIARAQELATFNPLYLFGDHSAGKSHLLMGLAHSLRTLGLHVQYASIETFTEHLVKAIKIDQMIPFRSHYRRADILILDDIHLLARRTATQEEIFHTFNSLHSEGKQIILASHLPPKDLIDIEPRLTSRFEWGLTLQIHPLDPSQRENLILKRAQRGRLSLTPDVAPFLTKTFKTTRDILIALDALLMRSDEKKLLTCNLAHTQELLADLINTSTQAPISPESILAAVSSSYDVDKNELLGKGQTKDIAFPRKVAMFLCRQELDLPYKEIGRLFSRDHSTVMSSIKQIQEKIKEQDETVCTPLAEMHTKIKG